MVKGAEKLEDARVKLVLRVFLVATGGKLASATVQRVVDVAEDFKSNLWSESLRSEVEINREMGGDFLLNIRTSHPPPSLSLAHLVIIIVLDDQERLRAKVRDDFCSRGAVCDVAVDELEEVLVVAAHISHILQVC